MAKKLELHQQYSRSDVHKIFSPDTVFTPQAGTWGFQGIVDIPDRKGDYVFFVSFGKSQGDHEFDEFITEAGVLSWQSQPKQGLDNKKIKDFIAHDELCNNIHLFLRTNLRSDYIYLGCMKYLYHDPNKEKPVYFQWQILDWPIPMDAIQRFGIKLVPNVLEYASTDTGATPAASNQISFVEPPKAKIKRTKSTVGKRAVQPDYIKNHEENQKLGLAGELLVILIESENLAANGLHELAAKIRHVSNLENDMAGYDILSFNPDGSKRHIEVKTTRGGIGADFFLSANEISFAKQHPGSYHIYRVFDYDDDTNTAQCFVLSGDPTTAADLTLTPATFKASIRTSDQNDQ